MKSIIEAKTITKALLEEWCESEAIGIRIHGFIPPDEALEIADRLLNSKSLSNYQNIQKMLSIGQSFFETYGLDGNTDPVALANYLDHVDYFQNEIRSSCLPYPSPLDKLWKMLDADMGAECVSIDGQSMTPALVRVFPEYYEFIPHNDILYRDVPKLKISQEIKIQFAMNIYLKNSPEGGKLQVWKQHFSEVELQQLSLAGSEFGYDRNKLPLPDIEIETEPGDLLLFDSTLIHAVTTIKQGVRVNISSFLGYQPGMPLVYWI
ncbi:2OG-Fe(II)-dependent halogenase WelO5 family protein [Nostoc sp.]|uniref:2OG-Fe(II)-dependent halogenase WelO5 family protein n=1 Tax=Nostoc sp. TaxID=1180 RepID=UPI002FFB6CDF